MWSVFVSIRHYYFSSTAAVVISRRYIPDIGASVAWKPKAHRFQMLKSSSSLEQRSHLAEIHQPTETDR